MKFQFDENVHGGHIILTPETTKELAALIRLAKNAKAEKPMINVYCSDRDEPEAYIRIGKISESKQSTTISNSK